MSYLCLGLAAFFGLSMLSMADAAQGESDDKPVVVLDTTAGPITLELDRAKAPITVDNFLKYVDAGFFDGLIFHRVIPGFMIQGGGMNEAMREKTEGQRAPIRNEASNGLSNKRGTICMARTTDPGQRHLAVLHQPGRQRAEPRSAARFGRLCGLRQGHRGHGHRRRHRQGAHGTQGDA